MRLPVEVSKGKPRDQAGCDELVNVMRIEALDC